MAFGTIKAIVFAAAALAAFSAQQSHAQRMTTMLPGTPLRILNCQISTRILAPNSGTCSGTPPRIKATPE